MVCELWDLPNLRKVGLEDGYNRISDSEPETQAAFTLSTEDTLEVQKYISPHTL
jgi:hypothetical protein